MRHLHPHVPANHRSQAEGSRAALTASVISAEKCPLGPGENKSRESSSGLLPTLLGMPSSRSPWTTCALHGPHPHALLPPHAVSSQTPPALESLRSSFAPGFPCCPNFCSLLPWSNVPAAPPHLPSPYGWRDLERCSPGTRCSPSSATYLGKDPFLTTEKGHP